jgi:hypothetical protein
MSVAVSSPSADVCDPRASNGRPHLTRRLRAISFFANRLVAPVVVAGKPLTNLALVP